MAARRLLILMLILLGTSTLAAALAPPPGEEDSTSTTRTTSPRASSLPGGGSLVRATVNASTRRPERIELPLGDQLALVVRADRAGQVSIPRLGLLEDVLPLGPARFSLLPGEPGEYEVRLVEPDRLLAVVAVSEPERDAGRRGERRER